MRIVLVAVTTIVIIGNVFADNAKKFDPAELVGKWELVKSPDAGAYQGALFDFTKDGKLAVTIKGNGKPLTLKGDYKLDGNKLALTIVDRGVSETDVGIIKALEAEKLVLLDDDGNETEFTKKK